MEMYSSLQTKGWFHYEGFPRTSFFIPKTFQNLKTIMIWFIPYEGS
jgi:hypothetical protein